MLRSMTGYGRAVETVHGRMITVELKSVNNRYLDCTVKAPRMYSFLEDPIKKAAQEKVSRGKLDVFISIDETNSDDVVVNFNENVFNAYLSAMKEMSKKYDLRDDFSASVLGRFPEVFTIGKKETDTEEIIADVLSVFDESVADFTTMREREGLQMYNDISSRNRAIESMLGVIVERAPLVAKEYREKLTARMREILEGTEPDEARLLTEAALFADRAAIDEETVRLRSHIAQLDTLLNDTVPVGRKLDFLIQEFNREANTIGSKANDLIITRTVVDIKAEIEKIREQVQNIE